MSDIFCLNCGSTEDINSMVKYKCFRCGEEWNDGWEDIEQDDWLPIDYSEADSRKGCFNSDTVLLSFGGKVITSGFWTSDGFCDYKCSLFNREQPTHYRPIPKGWLK